jgi:hypothetical protein
MQKGATKSAKRIDASGAFVECSWEGESPMSDNAKRVFWFDDHKTPNVADVLSKESEITLHRLAFDGAEDDNWAVMEQSHAFLKPPAR